MSARRSLPVLIAGALLSAVAIVHPAPSDGWPPPGIHNYRLMHPGRLGKS